MSKRQKVHPLVSGAGLIGSFAGDLVWALEERNVPYERIHEFLAGPGRRGERDKLVGVCADAIAAAVAPPVYYRPATSPILTLLSGGEQLVIAPAGPEIIPDATDLFAFINTDFRNYGADEPGQPTPPTPVAVYEMNTDATFEGMFTSFDAPPDFFWLTHGQIINFVCDHQSWLRTDGYATFLPFKSRGDKFVARVDLYSGGRLGVRVGRVAGGGVWSAESRRRVVVPQLAVL